MQGEHILEVTNFILKSNNETEIKVPRYLIFYVGGNHTLEDL